MEIEIHQNQKSKELHVMGMILRDWEKSHNQGNNEIRDSLACRRNISMANNLRKTLAVAETRDCNTNGEEIYFEIWQDSVNVTL